MPPVRTAKRYVQSTLPWSSRNHAPAGQAPAGPPLHQSVLFEGYEEWEHRASRLGSGTKKITFACGFVLTSKHVEDLLAMGQSICEKLWEFEVFLTDIDKANYNSATALTNDAIKLIAQACPNLRRFMLQGASELTHEALLALFESCPNLSEVEITKCSRIPRNDTDAIFALLLERKDLAPKLQELRLDRLSFLNKVDMKAMKAVTRRRKKLLVQLIDVHEEKYRGEWEVVVDEHSYQEGRLQSHEIYGGEHGWD